jgi:glycosyltransferase involved in cell wall biosynthesis
MQAKSRRGKALRIAWIVPGFSMDEHDWCIPALLDLSAEIGKVCSLSIVAMRYPYRRDHYTVGAASVFSIGGGHRGPSHTPGIWAETAQALRTLRADVIHAFWAYEPGMIAALFASRLPVVVSIAGGELANLPSVDYGLMRRFRTRIPTLWALRRARIVTAGSRFLLQQAERVLDPGKLRHVPLGIAPARWTAEGTNRADKTILNVGSLEPVKDQASLIKAFHAVQERIPCAVLQIVGGGREAGVLAKLARELDCSQRVEFAGPVPHERLASYYSGASLFAQASLHEAQGMAVLEAAASGMPIVGTNVGVLESLAPSAAVATPVGDPHRLAEALVQVLKNPGEATRLGSAARAIAVGDYGVETAARRFAELYESLVCSRDYPM